MDSNVHHLQCVHSVYLMLTYKILCFSSTNCYTEHICITMQQIINNTDIKLLGEQLCVSTSVRHHHAVYCV
jgi:hypothetical protein